MAIMPSKTLPMELLRGIPFFKTIKKADLKRLADLSNIREFPKKAIIFTKAEVGEHMFVVVSGRIKIYIHSAARKRKTFAYLTKGAFFGEMALLGGDTRSASAQAVVDSKLLLIKKKDFDALLKKDWDMTYYLLRAVCARLRRSNEEVENLLFRNILGRVSKTLWDLAQDGGKAIDGGILLSTPFIHQELADLVGTTREPLARAISTLRKAKLLEVRDGRFFIKDPKRFEGLSLSGS